MKSFKKINEEVYYGKQADVQAMTFLKQNALKNKRHRCRLCLHDDPQDILHEMFIVHMRDNYIPPHCHHNSDESTLVMEGEGMMLFYSESGEVIKTIYLNANANMGQNYIRIPKGQIHSLFVFSPIFLFKESTLGPFNPENMFIPDWAPEELDVLQVKAFLVQSQQEFNQMRGY